MKDQNLTSYKCVIVDDQQPAIDLLAAYISYLQPLEVIQSYTDPRKAVKEILSRPEPIDFLFLDIHMNEVSGLDVARLLRDSAKFLIFTTSFSQYALKAFDVHCDQFLVKPFELHKFSTAIYRMLGQGQDYLRLI